MKRRLLILGVLSASFSRGLAIEAWDVAATIYSDSFCMERYTDLLLMQDTCYSSGTYSNSSVAFKVHIVGYGYDGDDWVVDFQEFSDNCITPLSSVSSLVVGDCVGLMGRFRSTLSVKFRSDKCDDEEQSCSNMAAGQQLFYSEADCAGEEMTDLTRYIPLQGECLMMRDGGSQSFVMGTSDNKTTIARTDYPGNTACSTLVETVEYTIREQCYTLFTEQSPMSFKWVVHQAASTVNGASWPAYSRALLASVFLVCSSRWSLRS